MPAFDLIGQPWIPVRHVPEVNGPPEVGLGELFTRAHEIADITLPVPPAASGLWRILYLIASRITGLGDMENLDGLVPWKRERLRALSATRFDPGAVSAYFDAHAGQFDLFHPQRPWLQDARLTAECAKSSGVNKLVIGRASGNNLVWLSHHSDLDPQPVRAAEAAWYLLAWLYYGPSGKITARTVNGQTESNMSAGPLRSRISFHPLGATLHQTLIAGIPYPREPGPGSPDPDLAPWEDDDPGDPLGLPPARQGLSGPLAGQFRHAVLLTPSLDGTQVTDARITWAWRPQHPHAPVRDPYLIYDTSKAKGEPYARYAKLDRALWRDLDALMVAETNSGATRRPLIFGDLADPAVTRLTGPLRVRAYAYCQDGKTIDYQWWTASTPPVLTARATDGTDPDYDHGHEVGAAREAAERVADDLERALRRAWSALSDPSDGQAKARPKAGDDAPWVAPCLGRYWRAAETAFWDMATNPDAISFPGNRFIRLALAAYEETTDHYALRGPRAARALERARGRILASWSRTEPPLEADNA